MLEFFTTTEAGRELLRQAATATMQVTNDRFFGTDDAKVFTNMGRVSYPPGYLDAGEYDRIIATR